MTERNWALGENGAKVVEVSHEAARVASEASNLLVEREDLLWITGDAPQHVTLQIANPHPPLQYVGWHVWHDYLTNPKTVEVASGESCEDMVAQLVCQAVPGAGTQIWKLPSPIPSNHMFIRMKILETFGSGPTYMNHVVVFANDPGARFRGLRGGDFSVAKTKEGSSGRMSVLLKELDEDIRALHPIKTVTPKKNMLLYVPQEPMLVYPQEEEEEGEEEEEVPSPPLRGQGQRRGNSGSCEASHCPHRRCSAENFASVGNGVPVTQTVEVQKSFNDRLCMLEQAVASLTQSLNHQREDLTMIKTALLQQASERRRELEHRLTTAQVSSGQERQQLEHKKSSRASHHHYNHQVSVDFPEDALRTFVEGVVAPLLHKHTKRTESHTIKKLDDFLKDIVTEITQAVDIRVRSHLQQALPSHESSNVNMPYYSSDNRRAMHTPISQTNKVQPSVHGDYRSAAGTVPPYPISSYAGLPVSSISSPCRDTSGVPVSIIRETFAESDSKLLGRTSARSE
ncbi:uncharacterized protein TM35_000053400 [Trypanosoma theileri]|uniref:Uncharacterized protein n=1 Tax=Trypanosoma theileri TaxID=67003 RepID=A0A1X0P479_9TRYP|nr:uncharacterized protein TM35_000053400 [Trypanosoma theileri]ORC91744.1 hypothetical protein TM35_000053400 [Trypanosoma theileri]